MSERRAHGLAGRARDPERPDRQVQRGRRHAGRLPRSRTSSFSVVTSGAGQDVGPAGGGRHLAAEPEAFDEVVDVREMVEDSSRRRA